MMPSLYYIKKNGRLYRRLVFAKVRQLDYGMGKTDLQIIAVGYNVSIAAFVQLSQLSFSDYELQIFLRKTIFFFFFFTSYHGHNSSPQYRCTPMAQWLIPDMND